MGPNAIAPGGGVGAGLLPPGGRPEFEDPRAHFAATGAVGAAHTPTVTPTTRGRGRGSRGGRGELILMDLHEKGFLQTTAW